MTRRELIGAAQAALEVLAWFVLGVAVLALGCFLALMLSAPAGAAGEGSRLKPVDGGRWSVASEEDEDAQARVDAWLAERAAGQALRGRALGLCWEASTRAARLTYEAHTKRRSWTNERADWQIMGPYSPISPATMPASFSSHLADPFFNSYLTVGGAGARCRPLIFSTRPSVDRQEPGSVAGGGAVQKSGNSRLHCRPLIFTTGAQK